MDVATALAIIRMSEIECLWGFSNVPPEKLSKTVKCHEWLHNFMCEILLYSGFHEANELFLRAASFPCALNYSIGQKYHF